ncbi:MAG: HDOD domain-containing protein [Zetaproteobacteria bacterium]|nr:MAG: HDOD domain-containing protein [Zetaproteobacteria bacterium]
MDRARYQPLRPVQRLADGGSALARDTLTGRMVLLAESDLSDLSSAQCADRINGLERLIGVRHPAIPTLLDYDVEGTHEWQVFSIGSAPRTLAEVVGGAPRPDGTVAAIVRGVLWGLHALDRCGLHHGRLHPQTILLTDGGRRLLLTLPLLHQPTRNRRIQAAVREHAVAYLAPELLSGHPATLASDIYAVGILIHSLIRGGDWLDAHRPVKPQFMRIIDGLELALPEAPELEGVMQHCLARRPADRPDPESLLRRLPARTTPRPKRHGGAAPPRRPPPPPATIAVAIAAAPPAPRRLPFDPRRPPPIDDAALRRLKQSIAEIPPLPEIWSRIEQVMADPAAGASHLAAEVEKDPVLTAHLLEVANSAAWAPRDRRPQTDVAMAIARLGMEVSYGLLLERVTPKLGGEARSDTAVRGVWLHAQAISLICRILSTELRGIDHRLAATLGLLHDIGKLIIIHQEPPEELERLRVRIACGMPELQAEYDQLGFTHIDAGMMLALHWRLPRAVQRLIALHHHPDGLHGSDYPGELQGCNMLIHLAHLLLQQLLPAGCWRGVWSASLRCRGDDLPPLLIRAGLHPEETEEIVQRITRELERLLLRFPDLIVDGC